MEQRGDDTVFRGCISADTFTGRAETQRGRVSPSRSLCTENATSFSVSLEHKESERSNATGKWPLYATRCLS